jgi:hypothetical protein
MKWYGTSLAILTMILAVSSTLLAHEECDEENQLKVVSAEGESVSPPRIDMRSARDIAECNRGWVTSAGCIQEK